MHPLRAVFVLCIAIQAGCASIAPHQNETPVSPTANSAPNIEPQVTLIVSSQPTQVWDVLRDGFALEHDATRPAVTRAMDKYLAKDSLVSVLQVRGRRYLAYVVDEVRQRNLPMELALLPIVESSLNPYAFSNGGAAGLWQLLPATANHHGVTIDAWYDGRRDVIDSTAAALDYLTYLHGEFGDWLLAMAAYNGGEGRVKKALQRSPGAGFFQLKLPRETERYIPQVLALAHLISERNAISLPSIPSESPFLVTTLDDQIDLATLTRGSTLPLEELFNFNPGLNRRATPPDRPYRMLVPVTYQTVFEDALESYPPQRTSWQQHRVKRGESLSAIARRYHTSVGTIRAHNALSVDVIHPGQALRVPLTTNSPDMLSANPMLYRGGNVHRYKTRSGDSLWSISRKFNTTVATLVRMNRLDRSAPLTVGQSLVVPAHTTALRGTYPRGRIDSLARIADQPVDTIEAGATPRAGVH